MKTYTFVKRHDAVVTYKSEIQLTVSDIQQELVNAGVEIHKIAQMSELELVDMFCRMTDEGQFFWPEDQAVEESSDLIESYPAYAEGRYD